ncbi:unnamed protein product [Caenorhabditis auriculariae]|uniref:Annexin n=1 Tax=Caenorhabditis auriculariae TaxID=2777116 RepID=A0A8S1GWA8_9PELO|nr:unnamed protein product [Caenorhabditis auriculariae]
MATATIHYVSSFDEVTAAETLDRAIRAKDKLQVVEVLLRANNTQRQMIRTPYKTRYGRDMAEALKKQFSGDFEHFIVSLMHTPTKYDVLELHSAVKGLGTNENTLIEILTTRTNEEIEAIKNTYWTTYEKKLEDVIVGDTSGDFKKLLVVLLQARRDESHNVNHGFVASDATNMLKSLDKKSEVDKFDAFKILATASPTHVAEVLNQLERGSGKEATKLVEKEFSGDMKNLLLALIEVARNKARFLATQLHGATKGFGTRDKDLIRVIVGRSEVDLLQIQHEFQTLYGKSLADVVKNECKGEYRDGLLAVLRGNADRR